MNGLIPFPSQELSLSQRKGRIDRQVTVQNPGRVYFYTTYWPARLSQTATLNELNPGDQVEVVGREGLTLLVKPLLQRSELS
ncbi:NfeD family protein [Leptothoe sp. PORK10 BA2]|uniref:NfeD family protein n=1 Tax=Leptothoe sp. PORK10 BA2 TaxID=3110254 RepID=UPI003FA3D050